jgi:quercetin dioxygenase-like cupin family protein
MKVRHVETAFEDARGSIADILEDETIEHVSLLTTVKGSVRGNHYHRETDQWLYIVTGALEYAIRNADGISSGVVRAGDVLQTGPMESHALVAIEDTTMVVMTRGPRGGREYESDTYRLAEPLIEPEPAIA